MAGQDAKAAYGEPEDAPEQDNTPAAAKLLELLAVPNIAPTLDEDKLTEIAAKAIEGYKLDDDSRNEWKARNKDALDLAALLTEEKNYPYPGSANVKYPLLTVAALQFNARAYPAIIQGDRVAKAKVNGHDPDGQKTKRAERVSEHASWQLTSEMPEWEEDTDRLLMILAITGAAFRKRYWDPTLGRQCSRLITADKFVYNYRARSIEDCPRLTEEIYLYPYEIEERIRDGRFVDFEYGDARPDPDDKTSSGQADADAPHKFIEQHRLIDLDGDGYAEPYIVTIHLETEEVCRVVCNFDKDSVRVTPDGTIAAIRRKDYYTKYMFMPAPDAGAYGMGLGWLLKSTNEAINSTLNEMLDAGHLSNVQGGFISALSGIREKTIRFSRGEFKVINSSLPANQAVMPIKFDGPSATLFQLLGLLIEQGKDVSSVKDVLTGDTGGKVIQPTTMLATIEQGMKVFNAIFKRVHRAVKRELETHARINYEHLTAEAYNAFFDGPEQYDPQADYSLKDMAITPVSDPSVSTQMQKLAKAQVLGEIATGKPYIDQQKVDRRRMEAAEIEDIDDLFVQPDPKEAAFADAMKSMTLLDMKTKIEKAETAALLDVANAAALDGTQSLSFYDFFIRSLETQQNMENSANAQVPGGPGGVPSLAGPPGNALGNGPAPGAGPANGPGGPGGPVGPVAGQPPAVGSQPGGAGVPAGAG